MGGRPRIDPDGGDMRHVNIYMPEMLFHRFSKYVAAKRMSRGAFIRDLVEKALDGQEGV